MISRREDTILKSCTGLEGGVVASGSTCGVISGGALGLALMHEKDLQEKGIAGEIGVLKMVGDYVDQFERNYGTTQCRKRSGVDFYTPGGQIRYILPGDKVARCLWHIGGAVRYLYTLQGKGIPAVGGDEGVSTGSPHHCAQTVLKEVREKTGVGDPLLERLSFVFDGGIGLKGKACGALVGAIMAVNLKFGWPIRDMSYFQTVKGFFVGHSNLLRRKPSGMPEPFGVGMEIVKNFRNKAMGIDCRQIIEKDFKNWNDFQQHMAISGKCAGLIKKGVDEACKAIKQWTQ
jgi:hypothetical protein